jgi:Right handed beta helix region
VGHTLVDSEGSTTVVLGSGHDCVSCVLLLHICSALESWDLGLNPSEDDLKFACCLVIGVVSLFILPPNLGSASMAAKTLYVSTTGNDTNPGTFEKPLRTVQHAADIAVPGSTISVRGGTYCQQLIVKVSGNSREGFVTFRSQGGEQAVLDGACLTPPEGDTSMVELRDISYVRIVGFEIRNYLTNDHESVPGGIRVFGSGSHIEILNNNVHHIEQNFDGRSKADGHLRAEQGANGLGIAVYGTDAKTPISQLVIEGNEVHHLKTGSSESLVVNGNVAGFRISKNIVHDNNNIGIDLIGFEHTAPDAAVDRARDGIVSENLVYNITSKGNPSYGSQPDSDGIYVDGGTHILIERNVIHDVEYGLELASEHFEGSTTHVIARNNLIYSCHAAGFSLGGYDSKRGRTENTTVVNNTISNNDTWNTGTGEVLMQFYLRNNVFENNIIYTGKHGRVMTSRSGPTDGEPTVISDHNLYYYPGGSRTAKWSFDHKDYSSFEKYVQATGNDQHSDFGDPGFVDANSDDFHLVVASPARKAGENLGPQIVGDVDLDDRSRTTGTKIDIGCYEWFWTQAPKTTVQFPRPLIALRTD